MVSNLRTLLSQKASWDEHNSKREVHCAACNKLLAVSKECKLEIRANDKSMRMYGRGLVCVDCTRCGRSAEMMLRARLVSLPQDMAVRAEAE